MSLIRHRPVLFRADASPEIGTGHVMRCAALAQEWRRRGGQAFFLMTECPPAIERRLGEFSVIRGDFPAGSRDDALATSREASNVGASWVIADSYRFSGAYQECIRDSGMKLLFLDDHGHAGEYFANCVLDQNLQADAGHYAKRSSSTHLMLGTRYAVLRQEFRKWRGWKKEIPQVAARVLVTMGGADPDNVTSLVIDALEKVGGIEVAVVVGGGNPHVELLRSRLQNLGPDFRLIVDAQNMAKLMAWADVAVSAAGTTAWELAFMGVPGIFVILAENQRPVADAMTACGIAARVLESPEELPGALESLLADGALRKKLSDRGRVTVDGLGATRVCTRLGSETISIRRATHADCKATWELANDPDVRAASFLSDSIPWDDHIKWYAARLQDSGCAFYVAEDEDKFLGTVRFDLRDDRARISVALNKVARGKGRGSEVILRACRQIFEESETREVDAFIKPENQTSLRAFAAADFDNADTVEAHDQPAWHCVLKRERCVR